MHIYLFKNLYNFAGEMLENNFDEIIAQYVEV